MGLIKTNFNHFLNEAVSAGEKKVAAFVTKTAKEYGYSEADAVFFIKSTIEKLGLGVDESLEIYESMSDLDLIAKDSKNFKDFVKQAKKEYPQFTKGDNKDLEDWLQSIYDSAIEESLSEAKGSKRMGLSKAETKKVAETLSKAISKVENIKASVNMNTLEEDSFDIDTEEAEYDGGSYTILDNGNVVNNAMSGEIYGTVKSTIADFIKGLNNPIKESAVVSEKKITIKRQYTDANPAVTVGHHARIRNKVIEALKDGQITQEEFDTILKEMTSDSTRWMKRNSHYFNVSEDGITLSKTGSSILKGILTEKTTKNPEIWVPGGFDKEISKYPNSKITKEIVKSAAKKWEVEENDAISYVEYAWSIDLKENNKTNMKTNFIYESFSDFEKSLNEAFGSPILAAILLQKGTRGDKKLAKSFYDKTKIALDKVQDEDMIVTNPVNAYKQKSPNTIVFYVSDNEKVNQYADPESMYSTKRIPGEGFLLAIASGENVFYENSWKSGLVTTTGKDSIGISKQYKGFEGTGLYNVKRIADVADRAIIINVELLQQKYSTTRLKDERSASRSGATAFKSDKDFKAENKSRYNEILANKAAALPLDKMVSDAIDELALQIKTGIASGNKTRFGEPLVGISNDGKEVKLRDAARHMNDILDNYSRYVDYVNQEAASIVQYGVAPSWYTKNTIIYAKNCADEIKKIKRFNYAY
jgi:ribonuclease PH